MSQFSTDNKIPSALAALGVPTVPASTEFCDWLKAHYPNWDQATTFMEALPREWWLVERNEFRLCYLASEMVVREIVTDRFSTLSDLLPFGASIDGGYLVIDTADARKMSVGKILADHVLEEPNSKPDRDYFYSLELSYEEWLAYIREHPEDFRFQ